MKEKIQELLTLWSIQDSLLQTYRTIFLTGESIILSIAAVIISLNSNAQFIFFKFSDNDLIFIALLLIGGIILYFWLITSRNRGFDVSYVQSKIIEIENGNEETNKPILEKGTLTDFKNWQNKGHDFKKQYLIGREFPRSKSRKIMEVHLPLAFALVWIWLLLASIFIV